MAAERIVRCAACAAQFPEAETLDAEACPSCKSTLPPEYIDLDVTLTLNWDNLRLLANWATNWAEHEYQKDPEALAELRATLDKIRPHRPAEGDPLTLADTLQELANIGIHLNPATIEPKRAALIEVYDGFDTEDITDDLETLLAKSGGYLN